MTTTRRLVHAATLAGVLALLAACADKLPTAPTQVTRGITIYQHANYTGGSALLTSDVRDLRDYTGPCEYEIPTYGGYTTASNWNDCISSIRVAPGWRATVYRDDDYDGNSLEIAADTPNLQLVPGSCPHDGFNDCITSIRVRQQ
jgi:hypothetical protein